MPRSIQEIIDHADQLAADFEEADPEALTDVPVEEYLLQRAARARANSEREVMRSVRQARASGLPWKRIGELLGTTPQAAQQRYGSPGASADVSLRQLHVLPHPGGGWHISAPSDALFELTMAQRDLVRAVFANTQKEATRQAREVLQRSGGGRLLVHAANGRIRKDTHVRPSTHVAP